ncbi:MAG: PHP domain-containing protein [Verrucomicrobia bacterium]|nr:PHP domain-containing protein [Verrucomicrobiota bacterium]
MPADLHLHSCFSDGTFTPEEIAAEAHRAGLQTIALTDHDTTEGCPRAAAACAALGLECMAAAELTAETDGAEIHLLGYYLDPESAPLRAAFARFQEVRQQRIRDIVAKLNALGVPLPVDRVLALAHCRAPGRPHVARALVEAGLCRNADDAFDRFLKKGKPAWVPKFKMATAEVIRLIHEAGGLAVMAHPGLTRADERIPQLVGEGLDGIECYHTRHSAAATEYYRQVAEHHGVLVTGGSDCHGLSKGKPLIGTVRLPDRDVARLRERFLQRAAGRGFLLAGAPGVTPGLAPPH